MTTATHSTIVDRVWPTDRPLLRSIILVVFGSLLLTLSAKVLVPFWPVHMTMQTGVVLLIGAAYGWRLGVATVIFYLAQGALGLPVFTGTPEKGLGIAYMMGPTGGYLLGFVLAAGLVGWFAERGFDRSLVTLVPIMLIADAVIFALGLLWLGILMGFDKPILEWGLYPFVLGDLTKVALAALVTVAAVRVARDR